MTFIIFGFFFCLIFPTALLHGFCSLFIWNVCFDEKLDKIPGLFSFCHFLYVFIRSRQASGYIAVTVLAIGSSNGSKRMICTYTVCIKITIQIWMLKKVSLQTK